MSDAGRGLPLLSGPTPPTDSSNTEVACRKCNKEFNMIFARARKCNHCGYSYCHSCSDYQALMPRTGTENGYDAMHVCAFCIEFLTITAAGRHQLKAMSLAKLKKYTNAYNIRVDRIVEKDDLIDSILVARGPNGCLPRAHENFYRNNSVPNKVSQGRPRGLFSRQQGPSSNPPPPTPPRPGPTHEFARPDLAPDNYPQSEPYPQYPPGPASAARPPPVPQPQQQQYNPPPGPPPPQYSDYANNIPPQHNPSSQHHTPPPRQPQGGSYNNGYPGQGSQNYHAPPRNQAPPPPPPPHHSRPPSQAAPQPQYNYPARPAPPRPTAQRPAPQTSQPPQPPPRPRTVSTQPPPTLDQLLNMTQEAIRSLSIGALKNILFINHVNAGQILEKGDLVQKVLTLVEVEKSDRERQRQAEEREEMERIQREMERQEERRRAAERERAATDAANQERDGGMGATEPRQSSDGNNLHESDLHPSSTPPKSAPVPPKMHGSATTLERTGLCVICQDEEANIAIVDCGHMAMCRGCSDLVMSSSRECPLCRTRIVTEARLLRIFKT